MKLAQPLFILAICALTWSYLAYFRSSLLDRLIILSVFLAGFVAILFPDATGVLANMVGIGRGVDLCLYVFSFATIFCLLILYSRLCRMEKIQTQLIRHLAILSAEEGGAQT